MAFDLAFVEDSEKMAKHLLELGEYRALWDWTGIAAYYVTGGKQLAEDLTGAEKLLLYGLSWYQDEAVRLGAEKERRDARNDLARLHRLADGDGWKGN